MANKKARPVLVTTDSSRRGVFFGWSAGGVNDESLTLEKARNVVYWSADCKGVFGLAASGPSKTCKIGPEVPRLEINGVTSVSDCTDAAVKAFGKAPWNG